MGKPPIEVFEKFRKRYFELTKSFGKEQYLVPYLMSSHPGSRLVDAVELAVYLKTWGYSPEQVQDYYPTPGTASTVMYYTGLDPLTMKPVYCAHDYEEKHMQRALLQWSRPENAPIVRKALRLCGREVLSATARVSCETRERARPRGAVEGRFRAFEPDAREARTAEERQIRRNGRRKKAEARELREDGFHEEEFRREGIHQGRKRRKEAGRSAAEKRRRPSGSAEK